MLFKGFFGKVRKRKEKRKGWKEFFKGLGELLHDMKNITHVLDALEPAELPEEKEIVFTKLIDKMREELEKNIPSFLSIEYDEEQKKFLVWVKMLELPSADICHIYELMVKYLPVGITYEIKMLDTVKETLYIESAKGGDLDKFAQMQGLYTRDMFEKRIEMELSNLECSYCFLHVDYERLHYKIYLLKNTDIVQFDYKIDGIMRQFLPMGYRHSIHAVGDIMNDPSIPVEEMIFETATGHYLDRWAWLNGLNPRKLRTQGEGTDIEVRKAILKVRKRNDSEQEKEHKEEIASNFHIEFIASHEMKAPTENDEEFKERIKKKYCPIKDLKQIVEVNVKPLDKSETVPAFTDVLKQIIPTFDMVVTDVESQILVYCYDSPGHPVYEVHIKRTFKVFFPEHYDLQIHVYHPIELRYTNTIEKYLQLSIFNALKGVPEETPEFKITIEEEKEITDFLNDEENSDKSETIIKMANEAATQIKYPEFKVEIQKEEPSINQLFDIKNQEENDNEE